MAISPAFDPVQRAGRERQQIRCGQLIPRPAPFRRLRLPGTHRTVVVAHQQADARGPSLQQRIDTLQPLAGIVQGFIAACLLILFIQRKPRGLFPLKGRAVEA